MYIIFCRPHRPCSTACPSSSAGLHCVQRDSSTRPQKRDAKHMEDTAFEGRRSIWGQLEHDVDFSVVPLRRRQNTENMPQRSWCGTQGGTEENSATKPKRKNAQRMEWREIAVRLRSATLRIKNEVKTTTKPKKHTHKE
jgi:hypothetical protein